MWFELFLNWLLLPQVRASLPLPPLPLIVSYNSEKSLCGTDLSHRPHQRNPGGLPLLRVVDPAPPRRRLAGRQARRRHPSSLAHAAARPGPSVPAGARVSSDLPGRWRAPGYRLRIVCMRYLCVEFACKCLRDNALYRLGHQIYCFMEQAAPEGMGGTAAPARGGARLARCRTPGKARRSGRRLGGWGARQKAAD